MRLIGIFAAILLIAAMPRLLQAQARVETNVVYGMYSGLALLMDIHYPADPNGIGIVFIQGSGWRAPLSLDATPLKEGVGATHLRANALLEGGYTLFVINHRAAPRFRYPAAVEDAQRAVRYIRYHAAQFGIDPDRIGATGFSSGGHLAAMLGALDGDDSSDDRSPINRESSKVQAVVAFAPSTDFIDEVRDVGTGEAAFLGVRLDRRQLESEPNSLEATLYREASPITHVSGDDAPFLLIHGDQDDVVAHSQSEIFEAALKENAVPAELIIVPGGGHTTRNLAPQYLDATVEWFDRYLRDQP